MRITGSFQNPNVQQADETKAAGSALPEAPVPGSAAPVARGASEPDRKTGEINLLGLMLQSSLQSRISEPPNLAMLFKALQALAQQLGFEVPAGGGMTEAPNSDTQTAMMSGRLQSQLPKNGAANGEAKAPAAAPSSPADLQSRLDAAKKLAEEMKQPPAPPTGGGVASLLTFAADNMKQKKPLQEKAIAMLEQAKNPEEAKKIAEAFGGPDFKNQLVDGQLKDRLSQVAQKNNMPGLGNTVSSAQLSKYAEQIEKADGDKTTELAKDTELLKNATPEQKTKMINELGKGFDGHDDKKSIAIDRILSSCKTKAEFDKVLDASGGKEMLKKLNGDEAKQRVNELCGMWGRVDAATQPEVAKKFEGIMTDPAKQAEYSGTRPPSSSEVQGVGGNMKSSPPDPAFDQAADKVKEGIANKAFDVDWDQGSKVELIREQRRRELSGNPKLDYTSVTAQAEKITGASDDEIRAYKNKKPGEKISADDKKDFIKDKMEALRKQYGMSEQSINDLVTRKMGNIYAQASGEMGAYGQQTVGALQQQLDQVVKTQGPQSPEAQQLRARIDNLSKNFDQYGKQLAQTSQSYHELFPMPPSFRDSLGKVFSVIGDIASSVLKFVPGWGQAFSEIYTAAKAIGQGDIVGGIAGFGGVVAGPGYKEACHFVQRSSKGDVLDAVGNLSKEMGGAIGEEAIKMGKNIAREDWGAVAGQLSQGATMLVGAGGVYGQVANVAQKTLEAGRAAATIADGVSKGDGFAVLGGIAGGFGALGGVGGMAGKVAKEISQDLNLAKGVGMTIDGAIKGDVTGVLNGLSNTLGGVTRLAGPNSPLGGAFGYAQNGIAIAAKLAHGDIAGALSMGIGLASPFVTDQGVRNVMDSVQNALPSLEAISKGNLGAGLGPLAGQLGNFSSGIQKLADDPNMQRLIMGIGQSSDLIKAIQKGDPQAVAGALSQKNGLLQALGGDGFAQTIRDAGESASELFNSPGMRTVMDFTKTGTDVMQNLANGKPDQALGILGGALGRAVPELAAPLQSLVPMAQSMMKGDFASALKQLAQNPQTRQLADQLGMLQPLAGLAQGTALSNLQNLSQTLQQVISGAAQSGAAAIGLGLDSASRLAELASGGGAWNPALQGLQAQFQNLQQVASVNGPLGAPLMGMTRTLSALGSGDASQLAQALAGAGGQPGLLQTLSSGALSSGLGRLGDAASRMLNLPDLNAARALGQGDWIRGLDDVRQELQQMVALSQRRDEVVKLERDAQGLAARALADPSRLAQELLPS